MFIWWIMRHPYGIHVHILDQIDGLDTQRLGGRPTKFRMKGVPVHTFQFYLNPVDVYAVAFTDFYRPKADSFLVLVHQDALFVKQLEHGSIQIWIFRRPRPWRIQLTYDPCNTRNPVCLPCSYFRSSVGLYRNAYFTDPVNLRNIDIGIKLAICFGIHRNAFDMCFRFGFEVYWAEDAAEHPIVRITLCLVHALVIGMFLDKHVQRVGAAVSQKR